MEWDHDKWINELRQFLGEDGVDISDEDLMWVSNMAAKVADGRMSIMEAHAEFRRKMAQDMGFEQHFIDKETFDLEVNFHDLIDVTEGVKDNLIRCGQPGISDALVQVWAAPDLDETGEAVTPHADKAGKPAVACQSKGWFQIHMLNHEEQRLLNWSVGQAVQDHVTTN